MKKKVIVTIACALAIALIAFASGYLGVKLAGGLSANTQADALVTDTATDPVGTPQGDLPVNTTMGNGQEQMSTQATPSAPVITTEITESKYPEDEVVEFADKQVEEVIRTMLGKPEGDITAGDMIGITSFVYDPVNDKSATGTIKTLEDLRYCVNLDTLHVLHQPVTSIECLRELNKISDVCILGCSVSDLSPLAGKNAMREIWISGNPVTDASPVLALPNLREFNAYYGTKVTDISALPATSSLENFFCDNKLEDFTPLLRLNNLRSVMLVGISDDFFREMIQKFRNMSSIRISNSDINDESLKLLEGYNLYGLSLEYCGLKDISGLVGLSGVSDLRLGGNQIEDISVLKNFSQISYFLDLSRNKIKDLSPLENIKLSMLSVSGNPYTKASKAVLNKLEEGGCKVY